MLYRRYQTSKRKVETRDTLRWCAHQFSQAVRFTKLAADYPLRAAKLVHREAFAAMHSQPASPPTRTRPWDTKMQPYRPHWSDRRASEHPIGEVLDLIPARDIRCAEELLQLQSFHFSAKKCHEKMRVGIEKMERPLFLTGGKSCAESRATNKGIRNPHALETLLLLYCKFVEARDLCRCCVPGPLTS